MILGDYNNLTIARILDIGAFLVDKDENEVLLPQKWIPAGAEVEDEIKVFLYLDSEERLIATTLIPLIKIHTFAFLKVKQTSSIGAFLDWGLEKDLFVPFIEQKERMQAGKKYLVYLYKDEMTGRLTASSRIQSYLEKEEIKLKEGQEVDILIARETELGFSAIINSTYAGLLYHSDVHRPIRLGDNLKAYIKTIRPDNKIDLSLQQAGYAHVEPNAHSILSLLRKSNGFVNLHDKSDPEEIKAQLKMSKKTFKKAIGMLYREKMIKIEEDGIHLI